MLPEISKLEFPEEEQTESTVVHKTFEWDFKSGDFILKDGKLVEAKEYEYIKIWIEKALRTVYGTLIYSDYGSEHHNIIGKVFDREFTQAELERTIREALLANEAITSVSGFEFELDGELLSIKFSVSTIYGGGEVVFNA